MHISRAIHLVPAEAQPAAAKSADAIRVRAPLQSPPNAVQLRVGEARRRRVHKQNVGVVQSKRKRLVVITPHALEVHSRSVAGAVLAGHAIVLKAEFLHQPWMTLTRAELQQAFLEAMRGFVDALGRK